MFCASTRVFRRAKESPEDLVNLVRQCCELCIAVQLLPGLNVSLLQEEHQDFKDEVAEAVYADEVLWENVLNFDQTNVRLVDP